MEKAAVKKRAVLAMYEREILLKSIVEDKGTKVRFTGIEKVRTSSSIESTALEGEVVIQKVKGRRGLDGQFEIVEWPDWMPRTNDTFNINLHRARSAQRVIYAMYDLPVQLERSLAVK